MNTDLDTEPMESSTEKPTESALMLTNEPVITLLSNCKLCLSGRMRLKTTQGMPYHLMDRGILPCDDMTFAREEFFAIADAMYAEAMQLLRKKNADYSHGQDPLINFRRHGGIGVLVRISDKLARLETFEKKGELVNESLRDSCIDLANYSAIYLAMKTLGVK